MNWTGYGNCFGYRAGQVVEPAFAEHRLGV